MAIQQPFSEQRNDSAAQSLCLMLEKGIGFPKSMPTREVWARLVLGAEASDKIPPVSELVAAKSVLEVMNLLARLELEISKLPPNGKKSCGQLMTELFECIRLDMLQAHWNETLVRFEQRHMIHKLQLAVALVDMTCSARSIADEQLKEWSNQLHSLNAEIQADEDAPVQVREVLIQTLSFLEDAMRSYRLNGNAGLQTAIEQCIGRLFKISNEIGKSEHCKSQKWFRRTVDILKDIEEVTTSCRVIVDNVLATAKPVVVCGLLISGMGGTVDA